MADTELRRRHPEIELPPLHPEEEPYRLEPDVEPAPDQPSSGQAETGVRSVPGRDSPARLDIKAALAAARRAEQIIAGRERRADRDADLASDDLMRRRDASAQQEALARRTAVRQDPAPSRRTLSLERGEPELEAGL